VEKETWTCISHECDDKFCNCPDECYTPCVDVEEPDEAARDFYTLYGTLPSTYMRVTIDDDGSGLDPA
jgi:hypothetical protein